MTDHHFSADLAYFNRGFIESRAGRPLRILAEHLEPEDRFEKFNIQDTIVVMGSARILDKETAEKNLAEAQARGDDTKIQERDLKMSRYYEDARELSRRLTEWSKSLPDAQKRFVIATGGGPGIMEAANRGASEAKGLNIGLNIDLPHEQNHNPYITRHLNLHFNYFFMRKFWFLYLAKAVVFFPGGFGTMDEMFEILTLVQTKKLGKSLPLVLFGKAFWDKVMNLEAMVEMGTIDAEDLNLFLTTDSVDEAFDFLSEQLTAYALNRPGGSL